MQKPANCEVLSSFIQDAQCPRVDHTPQLRFDEVNARFVWVFDGDKRIGLMDRQGSTFEWISPHPDLPCDRPVELPALYHAPTQWGARVVLQWWLSSGSGWRRDMAEPLPAALGKLPHGVLLVRPKSEWTLREDRGSLLIEVRHRFEFDPEVESMHAATISYDAVVGSFVLEVRARLESPRAYYAEVVNLYAAKLYDSRPTHKKYQCTVWHNPDGRLVRSPHNPVGFLTPGMNDARGERRIAEHGFLGFFAEKSLNPVVELRSANAPIASATCSNLYDEHITCLPDPTRPNDPIAFGVAYRFQSLRHSVAQKIVKQSTLVRFGVDPRRFDPMRQDPVNGKEADLGVRLVYNPEFPGFYYNRLNDFEQPIPCDETVVGSLIWASSSPDAPVYWDHSVGHSGRRSIRVRGNSFAGRSGTRVAGGSTPHLIVGQHYRLSAWIRCEGVQGEGASVRFDEIGVKAEPPIARHVAGGLTGTCDWTCFECEFHAVSDLGWLYLDLVGSGTAWFDDVALLEVTT